MPEWILKMKKDFIVAFIEDNRWKYLVEGVSNTIILTFFALILGVVLGVVIAAIRTTYDKQYNEMRNPVAKFFLAIGNAVCKVYLTVIRGTPAMVQILIIFFIILPLPFKSKESSLKPFLTLNYFPLSSILYLSYFLFYTLDPLLHFFPLRFCNHFLRL